MHCDSCHHICGVDWVAGNLVSAGDLDRFVSVCRLTKTIYDRADNIKPSVAVTVNELVETGRLFRYCPNCGEEIGYE